jgi:glucose/arabinose dehydrogenase
VNPDAIVAPQGYRVEALVTGLSFPSALSFGPGGELYLAESGGVAGSVVAPPRVLRIDPDQSVTEIGRLENPIVGLVYRNGELLIAEDGPAPRILQVTAEGEVRILVEGLPGGGDYGLSGLALDGSGGLLFGIGTRTNSGVTGLDNLARGWVAHHPDWADVPGADVELTGVNYVTAEPAGTARLTTGAFKAYGCRSEPGEKLRGSQRASGAVYRLAPEGGEPERLAWGFRNPIGVDAGPDGRVWVTEGGMEERGSRPIAAAPDNFWSVQGGGYYGWPDFASGISVTDPRFRLPGHPQPRRLLNGDLNPAGTPAATFAPRSGVGRFDFSTSEQFGFVGQALVALSGQWSSSAYPVEETAAGFRVVRVDPRTGEITDFLVNRSAAPSSSSNSGGLERPFDVRFDPTGEMLYVVDMGEVQLSREYGLEPYGGTGVIWRITKVRPLLLTPALSEEPEAAAPEQAEAGETGAEEEPTEDFLSVAEVGGEDTAPLEAPPFDIPEPPDLDEEGDTGDETIEPISGPVRTDIPSEEGVAGEQPAGEAVEADAEQPEAADLTTEPEAGGLSADELASGEVAEPAEEAPAGEPERGEE